MSLRDIKNLQKLNELYLCMHLYVCMIVCVCERERKTRKRMTTTHTRKHALDKDKVLIIMPKAEENGEVGF